MQKPSINELTQKNVEAMSKMERAFNEHRTVGEWIADAVATTVGSWPFIVAQSVLLAAWVTLNLIGWWQHWDPYPFILLNLVLSFQAAYASPIIMMSQNRQAKLNERRNKLDLQINLLAEQENTKMLKLLHRICQRLAIPVEESAEEEAFEQLTRPEEVVRQIEQSVEEKTTP